MTNLQTFSTNKENWFRFTSLKQIPISWRNQLFLQNRNPFTSEDFLLALEQSNCLGEKSGWLPQYFVLHNDNELALLLCFEKTHSYGEYVFDWAWADAYHRNGIHYYPKLLVGVPYSPIPCSKWLGQSQLSELEAFQQVAEITSDEDYTSLHYLFPERQSDNVSDFWISRQGHQFHWFNQDEQGQPLTSFEQYLDLMTARKRKNIKKERAKVAEAGISCYWRSGQQISEQELEHFYHCYHLTYMKRGQKGYLNKDFFELVCQSLGEQVQVLFCQSEGDIIAAAMYFKSDNTLYGRYWGALAQTDLVHFEACYYQGIEFAIKHGLKVFNPGTQGEHKIARGFKPTTTYSYHHLYLAPFHNAVQQFCLEESEHNQAYMEACEQRLPFKK